MMNATLRGKPNAGNPHVRFDEGEVASVKPRRGSLLYKVKYIRRDIPEEISEAGGAYIQLVGKSTVGLAASVKEAICSLHCVGEASLIEGYFPAGI